ncbi:hypothetical protein HKCCE2091_11795 [Rhodobacterales bacterium HKCCE2091]|nr:hypothetical protein [Rhodobacterales bacterium HKCCE2091]
MAILAFLKNEGGAVTVDWVVLTGGLVGLGLATTAVVSGGVADASEATAGQLENTRIRSSFEYEVGNDDFENGNGGWVGLMAEWGGAYGNILRGGGSNGLQAARNVYDLEPGMGYAVMSFDVHAIDSWDSESFMIYANDELVATASFQHDTNGTSGQWVTSNPDVQVRISPSGGRSNGGYDPDWSDQSYSVQVTMANPGDQVSLGFGSTLDQDIDDESWGVDNVVVVSTNNP